MAQNDREKALSSLYGKALQELRRRHDVEFHEILDGLYAESGIDVKRRLTGERKRQADIAKAKALLAALEAGTD
jgi:hypothetical protein